MIRKLSGLLALALFCAEATAQTMRESVVSNAGQFPFEMPAKPNSDRTRTRKKLGRHGQVDLPAAPKDLDILNGKAVYPGLGANREFPIAPGVKGAVALRWNKDARSYSGRDSQCRRNRSTLLTKRASDCNRRCHFPAHILWKHTAATRATTSMESASLHNRFLHVRQLRLGGVNLLVSVADADSPQQPLHEQ